MHKTILKPILNLRGLFGIMLLILDLTPRVCPPAHLRFPSPETAIIKVKWQASFIFSLVSILFQIDVWKFFFV